MKIKKKGYPLLLILTIIFSIAGIVAALPYAAASKECMLGYKAYCTITPISTIILFALAGVVCKIRSNKFTEES